MPVKRSKRASRVVAVGLAGVAALSGTAFVGGSVRAPAGRSTNVELNSAGKYGPGEWLQAFWYYYPKTRDVDYVNDVGYLPNGESLIECGNACVRPRAPDPHTPGSPLPPSFFVNAVGYLPNVESIVTVGNAGVRPPQPDPHTNGSPLPEGEFVNAVGYLPNGESIVTVGNAGVRPPQPDPHTPGSPLPKPRRR
jgi:hypothetical protein